MCDIYRISEAITDLEIEEISNIKATAEKYDMERKKHSKIGGRAYQPLECLTNSQEALVQLINTLID
jgi:hypothetical protein